MKNNSLIHIPDGGNIWRANPIYDVVFKYLMEDNEIAKVIIHHNQKKSGFPGI